MKEYQILLEHILQDAESKNLHRDQKTGTIFKPKHGNSYHFEPYMEPKEYINDLFLDDKMFQSNIGNMSKLVRYLTNIDSSRFPFLKRDRNYIGFKNGILDIKSCHFKSTNEEAIKVQNYIDTEINIDSLDTPMFDQLLLDQFPTTFERFKGVSQFIMMSIGRLFFKTNELDHWGYILLLLGDAGRGKSTLGNIIKAMFFEVGFLNSSFNKKTGLSDLYKKDLVIADDLPENIKNVLPQQEFQTMVTGGGINVNQRYKSSKNVDWNVPLLFIGNYMPNYKDDKGQISRRLMVADFSFDVENVRANLEMEIIESELPSIIFKCLKLYHNAVKDHFNSRIQDFCPDYFNRDQKSTQDELLSFLHDSLDEGKILIKRGAITKLADFKIWSQLVVNTGDESTFGNVCRDWSITKPNICKSCDRQHIVGCCKNYNRTNRTKRGNYIKNMEIVEQVSKKRRV